MVELLRKGGASLAQLSTSPAGEDGDQLLRQQEQSSSRAPLPLHRSASEELRPLSARSSGPDSEPSSPTATSHDDARSPTLPVVATSSMTERSGSPPPPPVSAKEAFARAMSLSKKLSGSKIPTQVNESGDLMLDMKGYKSSEEEALRAEIFARKILAEELEGNYDIGALIGADEHGNLWIYSSEEAKDAAARRIGSRGLAPERIIDDSSSDPGYHSDDDRPRGGPDISLKHQRTKSDMTQPGLLTPPQTPPTEIPSGGDPNRNYAKTLRLTSDQLKAMHLKPGVNSMSFSVNRATCQAYIFYWTHQVPIVISDIDGTITK